MQACFSQTNLPWITPAVIFSALLLSGMAWREMTVRYRNITATTAVPPINMFLAEALVINYLLAGHLETLVVLER
jgi:hypothetical protein